MSNQLRFRPNKGLDGNGLTITSVAAPVNPTDAVNLTSMNSAISAGTANTVVTNANLTGDVTSAGNATTLSAATIKSKLGIVTLSGSNTGDQTLASLGAAASGLATASGLTVSASKVLLGGLTANGALSELTLGTNLTISGNTLNAAGGTAPTTPNNFYTMTNTLAYAVTSALTSCGLAVAAGQRAVVRSIRVCNISAVADTITAQINVASPAVNAPIANAIPVPVGGAVELLLAPKVMSPGDLLEFQSLSASGGLQVIICYEINTDTAYVNAGYITTTALATAFTSAGTTGTIIESILLANTQAINCAFNVAWTNGSGVVQAYLVCNYVAPVNANIEIIQNPFRLPVGHQIQVLCDGGSSGVYISGRNV